MQTGFGRLGTHYWGFETQDVVPDIGMPQVFVVPDLKNEFRLYLLLPNENISK